jgi:hypothetical protein
MTLKDSAASPDTGESKTNQANGTDIPEAECSKSPSLSSPSSISSTETDTVTDGNAAPTKNSNKKTRTRKILSEEEKEERRKARNARSREWRKNNHEYRERERKRRATPEHREKARIYNAKPEVYAKHLARIKARRAIPENRENARLYKERSILADPVQHLIWNARTRANSKNIPCTVVSSDIPCPDFCGACGIRVYTTVGASVRRQAPDARTLDRLIPHLGYVPGNTFVLCRKCNTAKNDATVSQLQKIIDYMRRNAPPGSLEDE